MTPATKRKRRNAPARRAYHHGDLRRALLGAAEAELAENGTEGFSLRGCARRAGVSHAAPAHHFPDARALLTALAAEGHNRFAQAMRARMAAAPASDGEARFAASGLGYVDFALDNPALFRLMFASDAPDPDDPELMKAGEESFSVLLDAVREARGRDPRAHPELMTDVIAAWSLVHGLANLLLAGRLTQTLSQPRQERDRAVTAIISSISQTRITPRATKKRRTRTPRASR